MKVGGDNDHYSYIADNYNHMTFLCKGKCRRYKQFFICFYKGASLRRYYPVQVVRVRADARLSENPKGFWLLPQRVT